MNKISFKKLKIDRKKIADNLDWSKLNFRKINMLTVLALLSYFHILVFIPLLFGKKSKFVQFHVRQGLLLLLFWVVLQFSLFLPILPLFIALYILISIGYGVVNVFTGRRRYLLYLPNSKEYMLN